MIFVTVAGVYPFARADSAFVSSPGPATAAALCAATLLVTVGAVLPLTFEPAVIARGAPPGDTVIVAVEVSYSHRYWPSRSPERSGGFWGGVVLTTLLGAAALLRALRQLFADSSPAALLPAAEGIGGDPLGAEQDDDGPGADPQRHPR
jgi:hypothetical protein